MSEHSSPSAPETISRPRGKRVFIVILALLAGIGGYSGWWWFAVGQLEKGISLWIEARRAEGIEIGYDSLRINGYPAFIHIELTKPKATPLNGDDWSWQGERLAFEGRPWAYSRVTYDLSGGQSGRILLDGKGEPFTFEAKILAGEAVLKKGSINTVRTRGEELTFKLINRENTITITQIETFLEHQDNQQSHLDARLRDLRISRLAGSSLGERVRHLRIKTTFHGRVPPRQSADALARWRDDGGELDVTSLDLSYGPLQVSGNGKFVLDYALQPAGTFSARIVGVSSALDSFQRNGKIGPRDAMAVKLAVGVLSKSPEGGGERYLDVPVKIENRTPHIGPFKLKPLPPINW